MIRHVKAAKVTDTATTDSAVTASVEKLLAAVAKGGDAAVRRLSVQFDGLDRDSYRLTQTEIQHCIDGLTRQERIDLDFAQNQVRNGSGKVLGFQIESDLFSCGHDRRVNDESTN